MPCAPSRRRLATSASSRPRTNCTTRQVVLTHAGEAYLTPIRKAFGRIAEATAELKPEGITNLLHIGVHGCVDIDDLRRRLAQFRRAQPQVAARISQPA